MVLIADGSLERQPIKLKSLPVRGGETAHQIQTQNVAASWLADCEASTRTVPAGSLHSWRYSILWWKSHSPKCKIYWYEIRSSTESNAAPKFGHLCCRCAALKLDLMPEPWFRNEIKEAAACHEIKSLPPFLRFCLGELVISNGKAKTCKPLTFVLQPKCLQSNLRRDFD